MKQPRFRAPQILVRCKKCRSLYLRYNYGKGRLRFRYYRSGEYKGYTERPKAWIEQACIKCGGGIERVPRKFLLEA